MQPTPAELIAWRYREVGNIARRKNAFNRSMSMIVKD